ncbi:hypothetical protein SLEP1_g18866 [Rubroshorea leprosula]|uniref:Uncharacterized protein n=1 Tax=Rubroshorea leprosula TaxID=152421 RepID=A0AAV5J9K1_9ROSI|nr:hypothetical protein SLEP1_g18866 [Rubroshorea leprosula]
MGSLSEQSHMVCYPLPHPLGAQVPVQRNRQYSVPTSRGGGLQEKHATGIVGVDWLRECAINDHNGAHAAVAPVWEDLVSDGGGVCLAIVLWDPLALIGRAGEHVEGLGSETHNDEVIWAASIGAHGNEVVGHRTIGVEGRREAPLGSR